MAKGLCHLSVTSWCTRYFWIALATTVGVAGLLTGGSASAAMLLPYAQGAGSQIEIPQSSWARPEDAGQRAHTNVEIFVPQGGNFGIKPAAVLGPPFSGYLVETPASLACVYQLVPQDTSMPLCNPNNVTTNASGGSSAIAIVDAFDYPNAASDLAAFETQFGLPLLGSNFQVIFGTGNPASGCTSGPQPPNGSGSGWDLEAALDIEWTNAMAPSAQIYLVEANSNSFTDLLNAVQVAVACLQLSGGGQQSNSWGSNEFSGETALDSAFVGTNITFFVSSGDNNIQEWPAVSPNVISVGGTALSRDQVTGAYQSQAAWENEDLALQFNTVVGGGAGPSQFEPRPAYQDGIAAIIAANNNGNPNARATADLGAIAAPSTGVWVYNTTYRPGSQWFIVGGTSAAAPVTAGMFNSLGLFFASTNDALSALYNDTNSLRTTNVTPVLNGNCGPPGKQLAGLGLPGYPNGYGEGFDPSWINNTFAISWGWCDGWGSMQGSPPAAVAARSPAGSPAAASVASRRPAGSPAAASAASRRPAR